MSIYQLSLDNLETFLSGYIGRPIMIGLSTEGALRMFSGITSRSEYNKNRIYEVVDDSIFSNKKQKVRTVAFDPSKLDDPDLIIYNSMREIENIHIVSNGDQTNTVHSRVSNADIGLDFIEALNTRHCEHDPSFTARVTGMVDINNLRIGYMSILRVDPIAREKWEEHQISDRREFSTIRDTSQLPLHPGYGYGLKTYAGDPKSLVPPDEKPPILPFEGSLEENTDLFWKKLDPEYRISLAGKEVSKDGEVKHVLKNMHHGD